VWLDNSNKRQIDSKTRKRSLLSLLAKGIGRKISREGERKKKRKIAKKILKNNTINPFPRGGGNGKKYRK